MKRRDRHARHAGSAGFTLIDMLIAFLIFTIGMAAVLGGITRAVRTEARVTSSRQAVDVAKSRLDQIGLSTALIAGSRHGQTSGGIAWREAITPAVITDNALPNSPAVRPKPPSSVEAYWATVTAAAHDGTEVTLSTLKFAKSSAR